MQCASGDRKVSQTRVTTTLAQHVSREVQDLTRDRDRDETMRRIGRCGVSRSERTAPVCINNQAIRSATARLAADAAFREEYEPCLRVLKARVAEWVRSGRSSSRLLEADELCVVRHWLRDARAWGLAGSDDLRRLLAESEAAKATREADIEAEAARHRGRVRLWVTAAMVVLTCAALAAHMPG